MILNAYKNQLDQLDLIKILFDFTTKNDTSKHIFGKSNKWLASLYIAYIFFLTKKVVKM